MTTPAPGTPAPRGELLRGAWAFPDDLDERRRGKLSDDEWRPLLLAASELLYAYSGRLYAGVHLDRAVLARAHRAARRPVGLLRPDPTRPARSHAVVRLPGDPVVEVTEVRLGDLVLDPEGYELDPPNRLYRVGRAWHLDGSTTISFRHGVDPPEAGVQAALTYAYELGRARSGDRGCRLPEAVQSVTRQGISYTILDRANSAAEGRTGLPEVDQWLQAVNPLIGSGASSRPRRGGATLLSADLPPIARMMPT